MPEPEVQFAGIPVFMAGRYWIVPPLSVGQFRKFGKQLINTGNVDAENFETKLDEVLPVVHIALQRNYPTLKIEELEEMLDLGTFSEVVTAIANASGVKRVVSGEPVPVAEK